MKAIPAPMTVPPTMGGQPPVPWTAMRKPNDVTPIAINKDAKVKIES
jgi:hypothetical protein